MFSSSNLKADILAIGVHPDDIELGCGGTLIAAVKEGKTVVAADLTRGELGTRGTAVTREQESAASARVMGVQVRENLGMADGFFEITQENILKVIRLLRKYRPEILICNAPQDRHPDHGRSSELVVRAAFLAGLRRIETSLDGQPQQEWRPKHVFHYLQDTFLEPDFLYDISEVQEQKMEAVRCYTTQFDSKSNGEPQTYISTPDFMEKVKARALSLGKSIGVAYAEGFITEKKLGVRSFDAFIQVRT